MGDKMINIGRVNRLQVNRDTGRGFILTSTQKDKEVFLPDSFAPKNLTIGQEIDVFVYLNTQSELISCCDIPYAVVGEYALLEVVETQEFGAFFDWGIDKDLLVPGNEQKFKVRNHEDHIVRVCLEEGTNRIFGTTKLGKFIEQNDKDIKEKDQVDIEVANETDLGYRVIVNKKFIGMIYHNEIFKKLRPKDKTKAYVKKIREDGLIDITLQKEGVSRLDEAKLEVLNFLAKNNGQSYLNDKSSPQEIKHLLQMSKKTFKAAIGMLYKDQQITISDKGISLKS